MGRWNLIFVKHEIGMIPKNYPTQILISSDSCSRSSSHNYLESWNFLELFQQNINILTKILMNDISNDQWPKENLILRLVTVGLSLKEEGKYLTLAKFLGGAIKEDKKKETLILTPMRTEPCHIIWR